MIQSVVQDIRYGARLLRRSPWFTCVGVVSLAVGLGSGVGLFTVMNAALFRPLPGRDTGDIHRIYTSNRNGGRYGSSSFHDFQSFTAASDMFAGACATTNVKGNLAADAATHVAAGAVVSGGCFDVLGLRPHLGRLLNRSDETPAGVPLGIVVSYAMWQRAFGADPGVVGRAAAVNGIPAVIVGVAEPGFAGVSLDSGADFWAPPPFASTLLSPTTLTARGDRRFAVYVRLRDGVTASVAAERLAAIAARLRDEDPRAWTEATGTTRTVTIVPERESRFAGNPAAAGEIATAVLGAIAVIVGLACVNLATMIMARGASRTRELNVRLALGASRGRLLRQLATESLLISIGAIALGMFMVAAGLRFADAYRPAEMPALSVALDWRVIGFSILVAFLAPILFGLAPGAHAVRLAIAEGIKGRPPVMRRRYLRFGQRELLLGIQLAVSFTLLVAAAVFMRSLRPAEPAQRDMTTARVAAVPVDLNTAARSDADARAIADRLLQAAERLPDVEAATAAALIPLTGSYLGISGRLEDRPAAERLVFDGNIVTPGYFELMGISRQAGRTFEARDHDRAPRVAVVSASLALELWKTTAAAGRTLYVGDELREVVGVVADTPYRSLDGPQPVLYLPLAQTRRDRFVVHARVRNDGEAMAALGRALRDVDARVLVGPPASLSQRMEEALTPARVAQAVGAAAGLLQLGLALMATWGLVAYAVERRMPELAIRRALGATTGSILRLVMRPSLWLVAVGASLGSIAGVLTAQVMHAAFIGLAPIDLEVVVPAAVIVGLVVVAAAWWPARRAASVEPASALKQF